MYRPFERSPFPPAQDVDERILRDEFAERFTREAPASAYRSPRPDAQLLERLYTQYQVEPVRSTAQEGIDQQFDALLKEIDQIQANHRAERPVSEEARWRALLAELDDHASRGAPYRRAA